MAVKIKSKSAPKVDQPSALTLYRFGPETDGNASMKNVLGGKGANLCEMSSLGLPVPPGFIIPCEASVQYKAVCKKPASLAAFNSQLWPAINAGIAYLDDVNDKLSLFSVRSGARVSMPGMMDTILNVGITSETIDELKSIMGPRTALDSYRRFIQMYSSVVLGIPMAEFEAALESLKQDVGVKTDKDLSEEALTRLVSRYLKIVEKTGKEVPDTLSGQIRGAVEAVFRSWDNPRAIEYRKINNIPDEWGTAVTVQTMVFGNRDDESCTGVLFSRDPSTGENYVVGEYLVNAQGEDVVAGIRTPEPLAKMLYWNMALTEQLFDMVGTLEDHYKDMQDVEFTVQSGKLFLLQTRSGKRSARAAFRIAHDMAEEGTITRKDATKRVNASQLVSLMADAIDPSFKTPPAITGIAAGGSIVTGKAVFSADGAINCKSPCILVTEETNPDDIAGMNAALGILTATGGLTSHAAVVARGMNKSCVVGCTDLVFSKVPGLNTAKAGSVVFTEGDTISIDGATGRVWIGSVPVVSGGATPEAKAVMSWMKEGVPERLELSGSMSVIEMKQAIEQCKGPVHIDTAMLEVYGDPGPSHASGIGKLYTALYNTKKGGITLDLTPRAVRMGPVDSVLDSMFGRPSADKIVLPAKLSLLGTWDSTVRSRITVQALGLTPKQKEYLVNLGFTVAGGVSTVADLLNAKGPVVVSPEVIESVFGGHDAFIIMREMIEKHTGKALSGACAQPMYWYEFTGDL